MGLQSTALVAETTGHQSPEHAQQGGIERHWQVERRNIGVERAPRSVNRSDGSTDQPCGVSSPQLDCGPTTGYRY